MFTFHHQRCGVEIAFSQAETNRDGLASVPAIIYSFIRTKHLMEGKKRGKGDKGGGKRGGKSGKGSGKGGGKGEVRDLREKLDGKGRRGKQKEEVIPEPERPALRLNLGAAERFVFAGLVDDPVVGGIIKAEQSQRRAQRRKKQLERALRIALVTVRAIAK